MKSSPVYFVYLLISYSSPGSADLELDTFKYLIQKYLTEK